jgi:hypothetical protein
VANCTCLPSYTGDPYIGCQRECTKDSDCARDEYCENRGCVVDLCLNACGADATCQIFNNKPVCSCERGWTGDPFNKCTRIGNFVKSSINNQFFGLKNFGQSEKRYKTSIL